ncbi:CBY1 protein, partial [Amia calva]|nr:CBY1 protein [Amia calva]
MPRLREVFEDFAGLLDFSPLSPKIPNPAGILNSGNQTFNPRKAPVRRHAHVSSLGTLDDHSRSAELGLDPGPPSLTLGGQKFSFVNGKWETTESTKRCQVLKHKNQALKEKNNYLRLCNEILLDMLSEAMAMHHILERDMGSDRRRTRGRHCGEAPVQ